MVLELGLTFGGHLCDVGDESLLDAFPPPPQQGERQLSHEHRAHAGFPPSADVGFSRYIVRTLIDFSISFSIRKGRSGAGPTITKIVYSSS